MLTQRQAAILSMVVDEYIRTAEPVSSKALVDRRHLDVSTATVRNELALLEREGYITHPYTSAGRVPSDLGYRTYVEVLMSEIPVEDAERRTVEHQLHQVLGGLEEWLSLTATILAGLVGNVAVVTRPRTVAARLRNAQLVQLTPESALLVTVMDDGRVRQRLMTHLPVLSQEGLNERTARLNRRMAGLDASAVRAVADELQDEDDAEMARAIAGLIDEQRIAEETYLDGLSVALRQPEFADVDRLLEAVAQLQAYRLRAFLEGSAGTDPGDTSVIIGSEHHEESMQEWSVVVSRYGDTSTRGTVAVIGPTRMPYRRTIPRVRYMAGLMGQLLHEVR